MAHLNEPFIQLLYKEIKMLMFSISKLYVCVYERGCACKSIHNTVQYYYHFMLFSLHLASCLLVYFSKVYKFSENGKSIKPLRSEPFAKHIR